jgi:hypothetical protein
MPKLPKWFRQHPVIAGFATVSFVLFISVPVWFAQIWPLFSKEPFFDVASRHGWAWVVVGPFYGWVVVSVGVLNIGLLFVLIAVAANSDGSGHDVRRNELQPAPSLAEGRNVVLQDAISRFQEGQKQRRENYQKVPAKPRPNIVFLRTRAFPVKLDFARNGGAIFSDAAAQSAREYAIVACFRNEPGTDVAGAKNVRAQLIYKAANGQEVGTGISSAAWEGSEFGTVDFPVGQSHCVILAVYDTVRSGLTVPWVNKKSAGPWSYTINPESYAFEEKIDIIEVRLLSAEGALLQNPPLVLRFAIANGKPHAERMKMEADA